jgi:hypothetical protein
MTKRFALQIFAFASHTLCVTDIKVSAYSALTDFADASQTLGVPYPRFSVMNKHARAKPADQPRTSQLCAELPTE